MGISANVCGKVKFVAESAPLTYRFPQAPETETVPNSKTRQHSIYLDDHIRHLHPFVVPYEVIHSAILLFTHVLILVSATSAIKSEFSA